MKPAMVSTNRFALSMASRAFGRDVRTGAGFIIGNGLKTVGAAEEGADLIVNARVVFHQPGKLAVDAAVAFVDAAIGFEDQGLRSVKTGQISRTCGGFMRRMLMIASASSSNSRDFSRKAAVWLFTDRCPRCGSRTSRACADRCTSRPGKP